MIQLFPIQALHYPAIREIYLQGIQTGYATFQTEAPDWYSWNNSHLPYSRLAAFYQQEMAGWAALTPVSSRCVYAGVAEVSIYVRETYRKKGVGKILLNELITDSEKQGLWTLQSGIFPENKGSIHLHELCGFRRIGYREKIGLLHGKWHDNLLMERRSHIAGI